MTKRRVEVDGVVMPATVLANVEHSRATQVADNTPHSAACQEERFGEVAYSAVLVCCDTEQHSAVAGDVVPAAIGTGRELRLPDITPPESIARSSNYTQLGPGVNRGSGCGG